MDTSGREKILVLSDFSGPSENAIDYAVAWARYAALDIHILNVQNFPVSDMVLIANFGQNHNIQLSSALAELEKIKYRYGNPDYITYNAEFGEVASSAEEYCRNNPVTCVVLGIKARDALLVKWFGSNTTALINTLKVPLLLVPPAHQFKQNLNIAFASDKRPDEARYLKLLHNTWGPLVNNFLWIHVGTPGEKALMPDIKTQDLMVKLFPNTSHHIENTDDILKALAEITKENSVDILVMRTSHKNLISRLTTRSVSREYSYKTAIPLFIFTA